MNDDRHRPPAEVRVDEAVVRQLLRLQRPELADAPLVRVDSGWDNVTFRLGTDLAVRLPRRRLGVDMLRNEQRWLPRLGPRLPLPVPVPIHVGTPGPGFSWPWSVVPWLPGRTADVEPPEAGQATRLADFLRALHVPAPPEAPATRFRGGPLRGRADAVEERLEGCRRKGALPDPIADLWEEALTSPRSVDPRWIHGDLHARNVLVQDAVLTGVIDWGDLAAGDTATDLAAAWLLFERKSDRGRFLGAYGADPTTIARARGWAIVVGLLLLDSGEPRHVPLGEAALRRLAEDPHLE